MIMQKRLISKEKPKIIQKTTSTTDPDAGLLNRPGKPGGMHYLDHQSIDARHGIIVDVAVTPGNVSDCIPYIERIDYIVVSSRLTSAHPLTSGIIMTTI